MVFEKLIRYTGLAVGLKPSATECEARLRGLERIMYSKTIYSLLEQGWGETWFPPTLTRWEGLGELRLRWGTRFPHAPR